MLEKAIGALQLLGHLAESGLPFQFKGGTSLLLRLNPIRRLSIDVDIVTQATPQQLGAVLEAVGRLHPFAGHEHDLRRDKDLPPKKHYRVFYPSVVEPKRDHIQLDVLFEPEEAPYCEPVVIDTPFIAPERAVRVPIPTVNALLGDKLTAFAPRTIGILHHELRRTDIAKQMFDVAALFDAASDLQVSAEVYARIHARQLHYRQATYTIAETLGDTIASGFQYSELGLKGAASSDYGRYLQEGVEGLQNHLVNQPFRLDQARIAAGKAACAAAWIQHRPDLNIRDLRYDPARIAELREKRITDTWAPLDRLKGANPEAFHYWHTAQQLLRGTASG